MPTLAKLPTGDKNQWIEAIAKLIKLTQEKKITWDTASDANREYLPKDADLFAGSAFITEYAGRRLRLYTLFERIETTAYLFTKKPPLISRQVLEFIDDDARTLWTFPDTEAHKDLMAAVEFQVAGVNEFLADLLKDEA